MKIFSLLIFCSLIAFIFNLYDSQCNPSYANGQVSLYTCSHLEKYYSLNECCMISYTDTAGESWKVCLEMDAHMLIHYEQYKSEIKKEINKYYGPASIVDTLDYYYCSSNFIKFSFLALLSILF